MDMTFRHFSVGWSCCQSARAPIWGTPSSTMWNTHVLGRASLGEQNLAPESGRISLSLQVPPQVCQDTNQTAVSFRFGALLVVRQSAEFGC